MQCFFVSTIYFPLFEFYRLSVVFKQLPDKNKRKKMLIVKIVNFPGRVYVRFQRWAVQCQSIACVRRVGEG